MRSSALVPLRLVVLLGLVIHSALVRRAFVLVPLSFAALEMAAWPIHLATLVALALTSLPERVRVEGPDCFSLALPASPASPRIASVHTAFVPKLVELA